MIENKYRLGPLLGAGGMGAVYRAKRLLIGDEVAIKILHAEQCDPTAAERFRREAQAAARLKHPNAVAIHDFGFTEDGLLYLVMELVEGKTLRDILRRQGSVTASEAAAIINQVCAALEEAHSQDVIHRDIKPDNIIVRLTPKGLRVKVLDFGIAKLRDSHATNLTETGGVLGTFHYMSPEQCLGEEIDCRSDIYSLGVVLFEMLTGTVPFESAMPLAVVMQHVNQAPPSLRAINAGITSEVEEVILRALAKKRSDRQQTAGELSQQLTKAVDAGTNGLAVSKPQWSKGPTPPGDTTIVVQARNVLVGEQRDGKRRSASKHHGLLIGVSLFVIAVTIAVWGFTRSPAGEQPNGPDERSQITKPDSRSVITEAEVAQFVERWRQAWNTKNLFSYSSCYAENFVGRNFSSRTGYTSMTRSEWINDKEKKFRSARLVSVQIGPLTTKPEGGDVTVSFTQAFHSDKYSDNGQKILHLRRAANGEIEIVREDFIPSRDKR